MNVIEIIYSQYQLQPICESTFVNCLAFIKQHYYISKKVDIDDKWFLKPLSRETLDLENFLFKLTMKNQTSKAMVEPKDNNPMTKLWC